MKTVHDMARRNAEASAPVRCASMLQEGARFAGVPPANGRDLVRSCLLAAMLAAPLAAAAADDLGTLKADVEDLKRQVREASEWKNSESHAHLAGYGAVTYTDTKESGVNDSFDLVRFNPIFHYQFLDTVLLEGELELNILSDGDTETKLEYLSIDFFLNDYMALVAGKFLSPLGQFRQNLHPLWINKLASAPPGFGEDQALPMSEIGLQLRGGAPLGAARMNYAVYVGNGPELEADGGEIEAIMTDGVTRNQDGKKVVGARVGILPIPRLEIGVSAASGEATVTTNGGTALTGDPVRDYDAFGLDFSYSTGGLKLLAESMRQEVGATSGGVAPMGGDWKTWYAQVSYLVPQTKWEGVLRYADYDSPHPSQDQKQKALGVNYWIAPHAAAKLTFESNDGQAGTATDANRILAQIAYGF